MHKMHNATQATSQKLTERRNPDQRFLSLRDLQQQSMHSEKTGLPILQTEKNPTFP